MHSLRYLCYPIFVPQPGQNLAPGSFRSAIRTNPALGAASCLVPQAGQNFAPWSADRISGIYQSGWTMAVPHSGQNFVPGAASTPSFGQRAACEAAFWAVLATCCTFFITSPRPKALANPLMAAPACPSRASVISLVRGLSSLQKPLCVSKSDRQTIRRQVGHSRNCT